MKSLLFNTTMVRAILEDRKTVTRRVVKPQPVSKLAYVCMGYKHGTYRYPDKDTWKYWEDESFRLPDQFPEEERNRHWTPPCHTDDILYVRETWRVQSARRFDADARIEFKAGGDMVRIQFPGGGDQYHSRREYDAFVARWADDRWHPSIHMPREATRIFLRVTNVRVERLRSMGIVDSLQDGVKLHMKECVAGENPLAPFARLWDSTIKSADRALYGWDANPWVWVIEFKRVDANQLSRGVTYG